MKQHTYRVTWLLALLLAACGGGGGGGNDAGTGQPSTPTTPTTPPDPTTPTTPTAPTTPTTPATDRIEPFDPGATTKTLAAVATITPLANAQETPSVHLPALDAASTKSTAPAALGAALPIGQGRSVAATATAEATAALLHWQRTGAGTQLAALRFVADGAYGVRLGVLIDALPADAVLRFYGTAGSVPTQITGAELQALIERNLRSGASGSSARTYWSPDFGGPQTTLEVELPAAASTASVRFAVPQVSHFTQSPQQAEDAWREKVGESGSCNMDLTCSPEYLEQSRSVARMLFVRDDGGTYLCTGTLVNDAASSATPYFLSANHCISTQSVASTLTTDWFYRSASCNSASVNPGTTRVTGGATLLYASASTDTSFLRLNRAAPAGIVYAGSYFGDLQPGTALAGVHHPKGDLQKLSLGTLLGFSSCSDSLCSNADAGSGNFLRLGWKQGTTEGGSSGSAAFLTLGQHRYVVGQLLGGNAGCSAPGGSDFYGRFDKSYQAAIRNWLNP